jgi:hypothetical protein
MDLEQLNGKILAAGYKVHRALPRNLAVADTFYFEHEYTKDLPPCKLLVLHNTYFTEDGIIYSKNLQLVPQSVVHTDWIPHFSWRYLLANYIKKKKFVINDNNYYLSVVDLWSSGYAHWILDALPRLYASREVHAACYLLLPDSHNKKYIHETLRFFNFKGIRFVPNNHYAQVKNMLLATHAAPQGQLNEPISRGLRSHIWQYGNQHAVHNLNLGEKIYISREKAPKRHILNEKEVQAIVTKYGFRVICFEDYDMNQQISIMRHAQAVITLHGAGVSNMLFMPENSHFLEIRRKDDTNNNHFFSLASAMQVNYWYQIAEYRESPKADGKNFGLSKGNYYDVVVDIELLEENIKLLLAAANK